MFAEVSHAMFDTVPVAAMSADKPRPIVEMAYLKADAVAPVMKRK